MPTAYFFRPRFDLATEYMHFWLGSVKSSVAGLGFQVLDSEGPYATPYSFFETLKNYSPDVIIADGHGDPSSLTGQGLQEVLRACTNNQVLSGKTMCAVSCLTGQNLGPDSRQKTAKAYIGWVNEFTWVVSPPYIPGSDPVAHSFGEIVRKLVILSCQHALEKVSLKQLYDQVLVEFEKHERFYSVPPGSDDPYATDVLLSLRHNKKGLITIGDAERYVIAEPIPLVPLAEIAVGLGAILLPFVI